MTEEKIDASEEALLREAFGDSFFRPARAAALDVIEALSKNEQWIRCDCRIDGGEPPYLIPVRGRVSGVTSIAFLSSHLRVYERSG